MLAVDFSSAFQLCATRNGGLARSLGFESLSLSRNGIQRSSTGLTALFMSCCSALTGTKAARVRDAGSVRGRRERAGCEVGNDAKPAQHVQYRLSSDDAGSEVYSRSAAEEARSWNEQDPLVGTALQLCQLHRVRVQSHQDANYIAVLLLFIP
ncbi:hypothetical protein BJY59DRAFT_36801 [Rhodotorula toruloides]